jgi:dipeptidyl aminopeptidase/acylaminoacyl peptidase
MTNSESTITHADYERAESCLPWNVEQFVFRMSVEPSWIAQSDHFWYRVRTREGAQFVLVDPEAGTRAPAFDHVRLAAALSAASGKPYEHTRLPFKRIAFSEDRGKLHFDADERHWECDLATYECVAIERSALPGDDALRSPDGRWDAFARDHNLWVRAVESGEERQLTHDGEPYYDYASRPEGRTTAVTERVTGKRTPPSAVWSPDGRKLVTHRLDQRQVRELHLLQAVNADGARPKLHSYRMPLPGDEQVAQAELLIVDVASGALTPVQAEPLWAIAFAPADRGYVRWTEDSSKVYFVQRERGFRACNLIAADAATGETREMLTEHGETLTVPHLSPTTDKPMFWLARDGNEAIWLSERDGWGHLYLYDARGGEVIQQITAGPWVVRELLHVDEEMRSVWFTAGGREEGRNPYYRHLYRVGFDGTGLELLTPEDADHQITASPCGGCFVDVYSRIDLPPVSVLRDRSGSVVVTLEEADVEQLLATGWRFPERITVKARDGLTDLFGTLIYPVGFDPERRYPVLDGIYPGPQHLRVEQRFPDTDPRSSVWHDQSLAELGFIIFSVDGLGQPFRSRAFHDFSYRNFEDGGGLEDHIAALRQLARTRPYLDLERVGIYGHSGGGYASVKALLRFPEFFKVAVSSAGNHDQYGYMAEWGEMYLGLPSDNPDAWEAQKNLPLADNLRGKLLLAWGEMDDNVHPAMTIQLIDSLIKAGKEIDMLVIPNANHAFADLGRGGHDERGTTANNLYFLRRRWDYFVRHLLGVEPPEAYRIQEPGERW